MRETGFFSPRFSAVDLEEGIYRRYRTPRLYAKYVERLIEDIYGYQELPLPK